MQKMSTTKSSATENIPVVMVRAFGGAPVRLYRVADNGDTIEVSGENPDKVLPLPPHLVFAFDQPLFDQIKKAAVQGDSASIESLWLRAQRSNRAA